MASIIDKFNNSVIGSNNSIADYNCVIAPTGDFTRITGVNVILNSWINILKTPIGSYDNDPEYGCDLYKQIFEPADEATRERIEFIVREQLFKYEDRASIDSVDIGFLKNQKGFSITIYMNYLGKREELQIVFNDQTIM